MPVQFDNFRVHDYARPLTLENAFRFYGSWAGIHAFQFDTLYEQGADDWEAIGNVPHTAGATELEVDASEEAAGWHGVLQGQILPPEHTLYFEATADAGVGVVIGAANGSHYVVGVREDSGKVHLTVTDEADALLWHQTDRLVRSPRGRYVVTHVPFKTGDDEADWWLALSLWRNDRLLLTYIQKLDAAITSDLQFGLAAYGGETQTYTGVRVPELCAFAEYGTLDPGEEAAGGLARAVDGRYLMYFMRPDGTLRVLRPKAQAVAMTLEKADISRPQHKIDQRVLKSHVRMMGAYEWAEAINPALVGRYGHRFIEVSNPMLMSEAESKREARRQLNRLQSQGEPFAAELTAGLPLLELEDRISTPYGDWVVNGYSKEYTPGAINQALDCRKYMEDI